MDITAVPCWYPTTNGAAAWDAPLLKHGAKTVAPSPIVSLTILKGRLPRALAKPSAAVTPTCCSCWPCPVTPARYHPTWRSEERRVGKECRSRRSSEDEKKKRRA